MIVVRVLSHGPGVKHFVHHQEPHAVAQVEKLRRRRIVCSANCIDTQTLQYLEATLPNSQRHSGAERASVVMHTHSFEFEVAAVEPEAGGRVEVKLPNAEESLLFIGNDLTCAHANDCFVKIWMVLVPDQW